jgi:hypothetical protein
LPTSEGRNSSGQEEEEDGVTALRDELFARVGYLVMVTAVALAAVRHVAP